MINSYFSSTNQSSLGEQDIIEDIIIESIQIYGVDFYYIPRTLVGKDEIMGEDRISQFNNAYPIECYIETFDGFGGDGGFIDKFGYMIQQSATLTVAKRRWNSLVGSMGTSILPNRPAEGDLLYFPLSKGIFEIMHVEDKNPFYQIGKLFTYKIQIELFKYGSEHLNTGVDEIDMFEQLASNDVTINGDSEISESYGDNHKFDQKSTSIIFDPSNPFSE